MQNKLKQCVNVFSDKSVKTTYVKVKYQEKCLILCVHAYHVYLCDLFDLYQYLRYRPSATSQIACNYKKDCQSRGVGAVSLASLASIQTLSYYPRKFSVFIHEVINQSFWSQVFEY